MPVERVRFFTSGITAINTFVSATFIIEQAPRPCSVVATLATVEVADDDLNSQDVRVRSFTHRKANGADHPVVVQPGTPGFPHVVADSNMSSVTVRAEASDGVMEFVVQFFDFS